jgi:hypothetical protein
MILLKALFYELDISPESKIFNRATIMFVHCLPLLEALLLENLFYGMGVVFGGVKCCCCECFITTTESLFSISCF